MKRWREGKNERGGDPLPTPGEAATDFQCSQHPQQHGCVPLPRPHTARALFLPQDGASERAASFPARGAPRMRRACGDRAGRAPAAPSRERGLCACAVGAARARWGRRRALREGRASVCPCVCPSVRECAVPPAPAFSLPSQGGPAARCYHGTGEAGERPEEPPG